MNDQLDMFGEPSPVQSSQDIAEPEVEATPDSTRPTLWVCRLERMTHYGPGVAKGRSLITIDDNNHRLCQWKAQILDPGDEYRARYLRGELTITEYYDIYLDAPHRGKSILPMIAPGSLRAQSIRYATSISVESGDTLVCTCEMGALNRPCPITCLRREAAELLAKADWRVILDGRPLWEH